MRIYAKQVPPEYQESPLLATEHDWPENVYVFGNPHYISRDEDLQRVRAGLEEAASALDYMEEGRPYYTSWEAALNCLLEPWEDRGPYTRAERKEWMDLCRRFEGCQHYEENDILCDALELISGEKWEYSTIRGCCQSDWQEVIYPAFCGREWLKCFEMEYFNTGSEWIIHDEETAPEDPQEISGYSIYCFGWNNEQVRAEIADAAGVSPEDVILYSFSGWSRSASYEEVSA